jgi:hypothetical protein
VRPGERSAYLTASEIDRLIIGNGLREATASQWKHSFLPAYADVGKGFTAMSLVP